MTQCEECENEATFDSPRNLCDQHWAEWWVEKMPEEHREALLQETLMIIQEERNADPETSN